MEAVKWKPKKMLENFTCDVKIRFAFYMCGCPQG